MWKNSKRFLLCLALCLLAPLAGYSQEFSELPPFDTTKTYQVSGSDLEALRLAWIASKTELEKWKKDLTLLEASFDAYRTEVENRLTQVQADKEFFMVLSGVGFGSALIFGILNLIP